MKSRISITYGCLSILLFTGLVVTAQREQPSIKGIVYEKEHIALAGATIAVYNQENNVQKQTMTNDLGTFEIAGLNAGTYIVEVSTVGYETSHETVKYDGIVTAEISITMQALANQLNEVVVVGYGTQKKINLTGAVDQVGSEVFEGRVMPNVSQMLSGVVPNLNINLQDGKPTRSPSFNIRGTTSIGQGGSALVLIDGVEGDPQTLNPNDIQSVSVLKDAASSAVYGSRGVWGVVLITTKSAKKGKTTVSYSGNISLQEQATSPSFVTDGYTYAERFYEAYNAWNNYSSVPARLNKTQNFSLAWLEEFKRRKEQGINDPVTVDDNGNYVYYGNEDYYHALIKNRTFAQDHNLSVSGSTEKADYYVSGRLYKYDGIYRYNTDDYNSYNLRAKGGIQVTDWLRVYNNMEYSFIKYHNPQTSGEGGNVFRNIADEGHTSAPIYNPDGTFTFPAAYTLGDFIYGKNGTNSNYANIRNTVGFETKFFNNSFRIKGDFTFRNRDYESATILVPVPYSTKEGEITYLQTSMNDKFTKSIEKNRWLFLNIYTEYEKTLQGNHYIKALLGYNYEQQTYEKTSITRNGLLTDDIKNINLALGNSITPSGDYTKYRVPGIFFRGNYILKNRYLFEVNGRYDGSSKFPTNEQWGFFPSVSAAWRISQEAFWNVSPKAISDLKIRLSYGALGNGNISNPYAFRELYDISTSGRVLDGMRNPLTKVPILIPDNLTWETAKTSNIGLDISALDNRLTITADAYIRKTINMYTVGPTLPDVFGADPPKGNYADLTTKGYELSMNYSDGFTMAGKPFNYGFRATLADNITKIDRFNNMTGTLDDYYAGQTLGEIWGYVTQGFFQSQEEIDAAPRQTLIKSSNSGIIYPGDIRFADLDGNNVIDYGANTINDHGDKKIIGNSNPRYIYSFSANFDWNNIFISAFFQGVGKQDWYPGNEAIFWGQYNRPYNNLPTWHVDNYWTEDHRDAYFPRYAGYNTSLKQTVQTKYLQNVAYFRLKNLQIGYSLPQNLIGRLNAKTIRIALSGENLFTLSPLYKHTKDIDVANIGNSDPDINTGYGQGFNYPTLRSYSLNILINF